MRPFRIKYQDQTGKHYTEVENFRNRNVAISAGRRTAKARKHHFMNVSTIGLPKECHPEQSEGSNTGITKGQSNLPLFIGAAHDITTVPINDPGVPHTTIEALPEARSPELVPEPVYPEYNRRVEGSEGSTNRSIELTSARALAQKQRIRKLQSQ